MTTITQIISDMGEAPQRSDGEAGFVTKGDPFLKNMEDMPDEYNEFGSQINTVAGEVNANADAAEAISGVTLYDAGITGGYSVGDAVYSAVGWTYRCIQDQAEGAVIAVTNTAYWNQISGDNVSIAKIQAIILST